MVDGFDPNESQAMDLDKTTKSLKGGKGSKRVAKRSAKRSAKKPAKKATRGKTKKAPSKWITHVKAFAKKNRCSYKDALSNPKCKAQYKKK